MTLRDRFHCQLKGHDIIRCCQRVIISKINLMLRRRHLVVGRLDLKAHRLQCQHHIAPCILAEIYRTEIKIARFLVRDGGRLPVVVRVVEEKLTLRSHVKLIAHLLCLFQHTLQHVARISLKRGAVRTINITD